MLLVEEVSGVLGIRRQRSKSRKRCERRARPLPPVADQILDPPRARAVGMAAGWLRIPAREVEDAAPICRIRVAPRITALGPVRRAVRRALELGFGRQAGAAP